ncbi:hypothetical protein [Phenylobacterium montanum]|uniref:Uncharacterized protein n=1 Tax=Phenylobacterium montanum TaxID=2823693 RepID=A0A975G4S8_9CAUL|nr:hypothetical protein [Caulobacter sp. S6]QUD90577.1 hypothetical protein KCG34_12250 [Caulobacter sp. S6]
MSQKSDAIRFLLFDVTPASADHWFNIANIALVIGAFLVAIGTYGSIKMGSIREHFADERMKANEALAATANATAERLRQENLKLLDRLRPRTLGQEENRLLISEMKALNDGRPAVVVWAGGAEAENYAEQIGRALERAGFRTTVGANITIMSARGVVIAHRKGEDEDYASRVAAAFNRAGVQAGVGELDRLDNTPLLYIVVGYKEGDPTP